MADKSIAELDFAPGSVNDSNTLFVVSQNGAAYKLTGAAFYAAMAAIYNAHGSIRSVEKTSTSGIVDTYTITFGDGTTTTFDVSNGNGIASITNYWKASSSGSSVPSSWSTTRESMTSTNKYLWHYQHIVYTDGTSYDTTKTVIGVYGDKGNASYVWIRYASEMPTSDADIGSVPDKWIGIYSGTSSSAPTHYTDYAWFEIKGETGDPATLDGDNSSVTYCVGPSDGTQPTGPWVDTIPTPITAGDYLWTKTTIKFNSGNAITLYTYSRQGRDGSGSPATSVPLADSTNGSVGTSDLFARADHRHPLPTASNILMTSGHSVQADVAELLTFEALRITGTVSSSSLYITDNRITANMRVLECIWGTPSNVQSNIGWTTSDGRITFSGTFGGSTTVDLILGKTN